MKGKKDSTKLEAFEAMQTNWCGLWYHPENASYWSSALNLAQLRKFSGNVRIYMKKNKFYEKDGNRPNYCFCIKSCDSPTFQTVEIEPDESQYAYYDRECDLYRRENGDRLYTRDDVRRVISGAVRDAQSGYTDLLPEDYV